MAHPQQIQNLMVRWRNVYLEHTDRPPENKLAEEVDEFLTAQPRSIHKLEEGADVCIVVMTQLLHDGWSVTQLMDQIVDKLFINIEREWVVNPDGTISHRKGTR